MNWLWVTVARVRRCALEHQCHVPVDVATLSQHIDIKKTDRRNDTSASTLDHKVRFFAKSLGTRSLLIVPVVLDERSSGLIGLHQTRAPRVWTDEEVHFSSRSRAAGTRVTSTRGFIKTRNASRDDQSLLEIAKRAQRAIGLSRSTPRSCKGTLALVGADIVRLACGSDEKRIRLPAFEAAPHAVTDNVRG